MPQLFANNVASVLAGAITPASTTITLASGSGSKFPSPAGGNYFVLTLYQMAGNIEINHEIVKCTARAGDVLTIVRAQEGTTARAFASADPVSMRLTAGALTPAALGAMDANAPTSTTVLLASATIGTPVAMIDFLAIFSNAYDWYRINFTAFKVSATDSLNLRFANGGVVDAGNNYTSALNTSTLNNGIVLTTGASPGFAGHCFIDVHNANDSSNTKPVFFDGTFQFNAIFGFNNYRFVYTAANTLSGFRLYLGGGSNFVSGAIRVYGYKNT
jgi:hypothetical protein